MGPTLTTIDPDLLPRSIAVVSSSSDLDADAWNDLVIGHSGHLPAHNLYTATPWLRRLELVGDWDQQYLVATQGDALVGGLSTHRLAAGNEDPLISLEHVFSAAGLAPDLIASVLPCRVAGGVIDGRTGALVRPGARWRERAAIIDELFAEAEHIAAERGERSVLCRCVDAGDVVLRAILRRRGYAELPGPRHLVLTVPGGGLDGYIESFPNRYRNMVRRELRKLRDAEVTVTVEPITPELITSLLPLIGNLNSRYGLDANESIARAGLSILRKFFRDGALAVVARSGDRPVGFVELVMYRGNAWAHQAGFDYEFQGRLPLYFGTIFYGLMDFASANDIARIDYSFGTETAKTSRGCAARPTVRAVLALDPVVQARLQAHRPPVEDVPAERPTEDAD